MEKEIVFEVLKVTKTDSEKELDIAFLGFKEMCEIYEKIMKDYPNQVEREIDEVTIDLTKDIRKHTSILKEHVIQNITELKKVK